MGSVGLFLLVGFLTLLLLWTLALRLDRQPAMRDIPAWRVLPAQVGRAVESGRTLHISLGVGSMMGADAIAGLAAVPALDYLAERTAGCDEIPIVSVGHSTLLPLALDGIRRAQSRYGGPDGQAMRRAQWLSSQPASYAAGVSAAIRDNQVAGSAMIGYFGPEAALMAEAGRRVESVQIGGAVDPGAQAVMALSTDHPLIGEEMFAGRAYLSGDASARAALLAQDTARLGVIVAIVLGFALAAAGLWR